MITKTGGTRTLINEKAIAEDIDRQVPNFSVIVKLIDVEQNPWNRQR